MEEQKKDLQESAEIEETPVQEETQEAPKKKKNNILWIFAGIYLIYTGYILCSNVLSGAEGASWGFFVSGIVFALIGAVLVVISLKDTIKERKERKAEEEKAAEETYEEKWTVPKSTSASDAPKKMSIAERANLASRIDDGDAESETEE